MLPNNDGQLSDLEIPISINSEDVLGQVMAVVGRTMYIVRTTGGLPEDAVVVSGSAIAALIAGRSDANDIDILMTGLQRTDALEYVRLFKRVLSRSGRVLSVERRLSTVDIMFSTASMGEAQMKIQLIWDAQHDSRLTAVADYDVSVGRGMGFPINSSVWLFQLTPDVLDNIVSRQLVYQWCVSHHCMAGARGGSSVAVFSSRECSCI